MRRVVVVGTSGSGKSTLAKQLAAHLNVPHIELDAIHWKPNWTSTPTPQLMEEVRAALDTAGDGWTLCGEYGKVRTLTLSRADTIIWLDYPMRVVFMRVLIRTLRRWWHKEILWNGNREYLWQNFFHRDSLFLWVINTWRKKRRDLPKQLADPRFFHARKLRFRTPAQLESWKRQMGIASGIAKTY